MMLYIEFKTVYILYKTDRIDCYVVVEVYSHGSGAASAAITGPAE